MAYEPQGIANSLLEIAEAHGEQLSPMKLQKLVYFSHAWNLGLDRGALSSEEAQAWRWGPVFPSLYHAVKSWGSSPIVGPITKIVMKPRIARLPRRRLLITPRIHEADQSSLGLLRRIWEVYGHMTALQLSALTHEQGGPWQQAYGDGTIRSVVIPDETIADFYKARIVTNAGQ
jgi:uncharacterized phage-associated protein